MKKIKVFISSVQNEFAAERQVLYDYMLSDALLGRFFDPFIFEKLPAADVRADKAYLSEVKHSDIYLGILGKEYGSVDAEGFSPTKREFDLACRENKTRLIFITSHINTERHPKELALINIAEGEVIRKKFSSSSELKTAVYASLIRYLEEKDYIRTGPFDASPCLNATLEDIDSEKVKEFVLLAKSKRGFPLPATSELAKILTHLNLLDDGRIANAAILLFGKQPERFFINAEVKCAQFHGTTISKPVPSYQVYKGDVFQLVNQAVDFVLSRINVEVGQRNIGVDVPLAYEIPRAVIAEAIVNAVAHRDYTSNATVQVMLFRDRLEIWNPGQLPYNLTLSQLKQPHSSFPSNPLIAEPLYLTGYIERLGTGTLDMIRLCKEAGLNEPEFKQEDVFKTIIRRSGQATGQASGELTGEAGGELTGEVAEEIRRIVIVLQGEMKRAEIQEALQLRHDDYFRTNYIIPALDSDYIEMKYPEIPNHPNQSYRLTTKGKELAQELKNKET